MAARTGRTPALLMVASLVSAISAAAQAPVLKPGPAEGFQGVKARELETIGGALSRLSERYAVHRRTKAGEPFDPGDALMPVLDDRVVVDAVADGEAAELLVALEGLGLEHGAAAGRIVSGQLPIGAIPEAASLDGLRFVRPAYVATAVGLTTSQGDVAMRSDDARALFGVDGSGVTVGTLSDSYDCLGGAFGDVITGDLPPGVVVLLDEAGCLSGTDEGRAMMQLVADVAPGADQAFHTAFGGQAVFATGIVLLATVGGAEVIVDDVIYFAEPMFQDGLIAQAVDTVVGSGIPYFSAAGNNGRLSYEGAFIPSGFTVSGLGEAHDFLPGAGVDNFQRITIPAGAQLAVAFQWNEPFFSVSGAPGSAGDLDIFLTDQPPTVILAASTDANVGGDPVEVLTYFNAGPETSFNLAIERFSPLGTEPGVMKTVLFGPGVAIDEHDTASRTVYGHAAAGGAESVGAAAYFNTPELGVSPAVLEGFSSAGPAEIHYDTGGDPAFELRQKPEIVCPDGTNTTFFGGSDLEPDGFPNFFGTSAAAPHAAAVAALVRELVPALGPEGIYTLLESQADDMGPPGPDDDSGFGFCLATDAVLGSVIFVDGFESGDVSAWSNTVP